MEKKEYSIVVSSLFLIAIIVCLICDVAIHNMFTWSLLAVASILFVWSILFPIMKLGRNGISWSLLVFTILLLPFLYILEKLVLVPNLFLMGACISLVSLWYIWSIYFLFRVLVKRAFMVVGIAFLLAIPLELFIHIILVRFSIENGLSSWDYLSLILLFVFAFIFLEKDLVHQKMLKLKEKEKIGK